jgi:hypothetical protein
MGVEKLASASSWGIMALVNVMSPQLRLLVGHLPILQYFFAECSVICRL